MLRNSFIHLPGIGPRKERCLWGCGILDWDLFLAGIADGFLRERTYRDAEEMVRYSAKALAEYDVGFFNGMLPRSETWRIYPEFVTKALFLDIETTGLSPWEHELTLIGAFNTGEFTSFINGVNLTEFPSFVRRFPLLVTFNGSQFDLPFLEAHFPSIQMDQAHIDLRFVFSSMGYGGGLKAVEVAMGLQRDERIDDVRGKDAVRLWSQHIDGDGAALAQLILYNQFDVMNLVELVEIAVQLKARHLAFPGATMRQA